MHLHPWGTWPSDKQDTLRDRLINIIYRLSETIDYYDDILGVAADKVADAIIEHLDELQKIQGIKTENNKESQKRENAENTDCGCVCKTQKPSHC